VETEGKSMMILCEPENDAVEKILCNFGKTKIFIGSYPRDK
jgi:hypothetical protein